MYWPAKVTEFKVSFQAKQQIFWLEVSMNHFLTMTCLCQLAYVLWNDTKCVKCYISYDYIIVVIIQEYSIHRSCSFFIKSTHLLQFLVEVTLCGILQNQVDSTVIMKISIQLQNVRVPVVLSNIFDHVNVLTVNVIVFLLLFWVDVWPHLLPIEPYTIPLKQKMSYSDNVTKLLYLHGWLFFSRAK